MSRGLHDMGLWRRGPLTIPPNSLRAWVQLAVWEIWMGMLVCVILGFGIALITTSPNHIVTISDLSSCYAPPPVTLPCERVVYRGGILNVAFTALFGVLLIGVAAWFLWELWNAVEPRPITDDFLKLLNDSFGRNWRNPLTWPWMRIWWAYGFTIVGAAVTASIGITIWALVASSHGTKPPTARVETSQSFSVGQQ
jgi:hypothetical protein